MHSETDLNNINLCYSEYGTVFALSFSGVMSEITVNYIESTIKLSNYC